MRSSASGNTVENHETFASTSPQETFVQSQVLDLFTWFFGCTVLYRHTMPPVSGPAGAPSEDPPGKACRSSAVHALRVHGVVPCLLKMGRVGKFRLQTWSGWKLLATYRSRSTMEPPSQEWVIKLYRSSLRVLRLPHVHECFGMINS